MPAVTSYLPICYTINKINQKIKNYEPQNGFISSYKRLPFEVRSRGVTPFESTYVGLAP